MKKILAIIAVLFMTVTTYGQVIQLGAAGTQPTYTGCTMTVTDIGGTNGDYQSNRDDVVTLISNDPNNGAVAVNVDITSMDIPCGDTLFIYDGPAAVDSMLLDYFTSCDSLQTSVITVAATVRSNGSITIRFKTDGDTVGAGFIITTECVSPCQRINVEIDPSLSSKVPYMDADGYFYLDVCPYDTIMLAARGIYPDNDFSYHQDDAHATFHWDFGWEIIDTLGGNVLGRQFPEGRGYDVAISITDSAGCFSYVPYTFRVRTSSNPIREVLDFPEVCAGTEVELSVGYDFISALQVDTVGSEQVTSLSVTDTVFLPDGQDCGNGCSYISPVTFTSFSPAATITSANDILFVRVFIEHSYVGDVWIRLTCPNQQYVSILKKYQSSSTTGCSGLIPAGEWGWNTSDGGYCFFGNYYEPDGTDKCDPTQNPMGGCWNYCWSNATNQGYQYNSGSYVYSNANRSGNYLDSTNVAQMTNVFHPDGSFASLIGCPMNGTWSIEVVDGWGSDNGYMCGWEMALDPSLLPQDWSYQVLVDSAWLVGPGADGPVVVPDSAGELTYQIYVMDELGCVYDTVNHMSVVGHPQPNLGEDFNICYGDITVLDPHYTQGGAEGQTTVYHWNTGDETSSIEVLTAGDYFVNIATTSESGLTCEGSDTIHIDMFEKPIFDFDLPEMSGCAPLNLRIENNSTPAGSSYEWYISTLDDFGNMNLAYSSTLESPTFQLNDPGVYSVTVKVQTPDGCRDSLTMWNYIVVNPQPLAEFEADPAISMLSENGGVVNFINYADPSTAMGDQGSFYWDFGDGTVDSIHFSDPHTYTTWGDFNVTLHVESNSGCSSEITHTVVIEQDLIFPNVITPNGDGINDVFAIENLNTNINEEDPDAYRNNRLLVHDRWGNKVYDAKNYDTYAKDGVVYPGSKIFDGSGLSDGTYFYTFYYKGKAKTISFNGSLTILR